MNNFTDRSVSRKNIFGKIFADTTALYTRVDESVNRQTDWQRRLMKDAIVRRGDEIEASGGNKSNFTDEFPLLNTPTSHINTSESK